jgi:hypothetical protein
VTAAPTGELVEVPREWVLSLNVTFHDASAAEVGCLALEDALGGQAPLRLLEATRLGERRVRVVFGIVARSASEAIADASALLVTRLLDVRPVPLWIPASLTAQPSQG